MEAEKMDPNGIKMTPEEAERIRRVTQAAYEEDGGLDPYLLELSDVLPSSAFQDVDLS